MRFFHQKFSKKILDLKLLKEKQDISVVDLSSSNLEPLKMVNYLLNDFQGNLASNLENSFSDWLVKDKIRI
jgi:hypothetical protein